MLFQMNYIIQEENPVPRPLKERECKCGCGYKFQPKRRDQIYLNKQHADYGYNHGKRKKANKREKEISAALRRNDRILEKHYKAHGREEAICFLNILKADGFQLQYFIGYNNIDNISFLYTYNYLFHIDKSQPQKLVKIRKR